MRDGAAERFELLRVNMGLDLREEPLVRRLENLQVAGKNRVAYVPIDSHTAHLVPIQDLLEAGWRKVIVTTDHGWLFMPGGLPKVNLPAHLTESKWGRCALPQPGAKHDLPEVSWFWGAEHPIVLAPGVSVFRAGVEYAHGGLTLQEAMIATLTVQALVPNLAMTIGELKWAGLRLQVSVSGPQSGASVDLRTKAADASSSVLKEGQRTKPLGVDGKVSIAVEDDGMIGQAAFVVVIHGGQVVAKQSVTIGEN